MNSEQKTYDHHRAWWKEVVVYQIYPRSFQDSNADGVGDLTGIISRLDYVKSLGVDVIWLNPIFDSPNDDMGYDIRDYRRIMTEFGTMKDFDALLAGVHERGMKLILDLVVNHTSDEHPWFVEGRTSRSSEHYNYYHWWPAENGKPPYRASYFDEDGYAWKYNKPTDSYYLHYFSLKQPDLNWDNRKVREEVYDIIRFWFDKGIDGFRMDSIPLIGKDPKHPVIDTESYPYMFDFYATSEHMHRYLQEMNREVLSQYDKLDVGEGSAVKVRDAWKFVDPSRQELQMLYHFGPSEVRNWTGPDSPDSGIEYSLVELKKMFDDWDKQIGDGWPVIYLGNHDQPRMVSRFASDKPEFRDNAAKMLTTFLLTMRGTVYWYAGDEIGMANPRYETIEDYKDIATLNEYARIAKQGGDLEEFMEHQKEASRENSRSPFQWDDTPNTGFSTGEPWLAVAKDYRQVNRAAQEDDPHSVLNYFRDMISMRKKDPLFIYGDFTLVDPEHHQIFAYTRSMEGRQVLVALNFSPKDAELELGDAMELGELIAHNYEGVGDKPQGSGTDGNELDPAQNGVLKLRPFEAVVYKLK